MKEIVNIKNVKIGYDKKEILEVNFKIYNGDFFVISGDNASGKSLLLKLLYMKILPKVGNIFFFGENINKESKDQILEYRKKIGVILDNDTLIPFFTVYQNIELASEIQNKKKDFEVRIVEILNWMDLNSIKNKQVNQLSSGQKQKVNIARALINNPRIIIADQPYKNLDELTKKKLDFLFNSINKLGTTLIVATNNLNIENKSVRRIELNKR